jgi:hypothetical protein
MHEIEARREAPQHGARHKRSQRARVPRQRDGIDIGERYAPVVKRRLQGLGGERAGSFDAGKALFLENKLRHAVGHERDARVMAFGDDTEYAHKFTPTREPCVCSQPSCDEADLTRLFHPDPAWGANGSCPQANCGRN